MASNEVEIGKRPVVSADLLDEYFVYDHVDDEYRCCVSLGRFNHPNDTYEEDTCGKKFSTYTKNKKGSSGGSRTGNRSKHLETKHEAQFKVFQF